MKMHGSLYTDKAKVVNAFRKDEKVLLSFDSSSYFCVHEEPRELSHDTYYELDDGTKIERQQSVVMMAFQEKVSMLLRAKSKSVGIPLPLPKGEYRVDITVTTQRQADDVPPLLVMKSVLDGINKEIVENDRQIYECNIRYHYKKRYANASQYRSNESLKIALFDLGSSGGPIIEVSGDIYIVPKQSPILRDGGDRLLTDDADRHRYLARPLKRKMKIAPCKSYSIEMCFTGDTDDKDIDNMALIYYPILGHLGINEAQVHYLHLEKHKSTTSPSIETQIKCKTP
ncbi:hypothetical protein M4D70_17250 [Brevibacillus borstelensis]|uniref:hypothetical protein n=1 Tax=Brevibacillus borstelensis TaxID=45462 RepID=UPI00203AD152|nr:hypothetical protein [Brevibacillus borstelensis]MCM3560725.1 hypothetical protein [Brevibacillus borstelensis]MCM3623979.1 hypothetical protein [Brevibacillus borstelensis]